MSIAGTLNGLRTSYARAIMDEPVLAGIVGTAVARVLPHLADRPDQVVIDLFRKADGAEQIYGLHVGDADAAPETDAPYAQLPLLVFSAKNNLKSVVTDSIHAGRPYGTASPELEHAVGGVIERRRVAMVFWIAAVRYMKLAMRHGIDFDPLHGDRLTAPPEAADGVVDLNAMLRQLDPDW